MEEEMAIIESIIREEAELNGEAVDDVWTGWKTVKTKPSRRRSSHKQKNSAVITPDFIRSLGASVVVVEDSSSDLIKAEEERRRRVVEAQRDALEIASAGVRFSSGSSSQSEEVNEEEEKPAVATGGVRTLGLAAADNAGDRNMKKRKQKISVADATAKIDVDHLAAFLLDASINHGLQEDVQLKRFGNYFKRAFAPVGSDEFPWLKLLKESSVANMIDIPLAHLPKTAYKTCANWIDQKSITAVGSFILWQWDDILSSQANNHGTTKGGKKVVFEEPADSKIAAFMVLAVALRRKPAALIGLLPELRKNPKYIAKQMLPLNTWVITQAFKGDLTVGLYMWVHLLVLPVLGGVSDPRSRDMILQVAERILSFPGAREVLLNGAVRKGERLVPPSALELLMRLTFPPSYARIKATARFEAIYPTIKSIALASSSSKKEMKQLSEHIFNVAIKVAGEGVSNLSDEATDLAIWCLTTNPACFDQWDKLYMDNLQPSIAILRKLTAEHKGLSTDRLTQAIENFRKKNRNALTNKDRAPLHSYLMEADWQCKKALLRLALDERRFKIMASVLVILGICIILSTMAFFRSY